MDDRAATFEQRALDCPVLLNSVPKSGTHLLLNILRMFTPVEQVHRVFVGDWNIKEQSGYIKNGPSFLFTGHVNFNAETVVAVRPCRQLLLVRDPYDYAIAYARFLMSEGQESEQAAAIRTHRMSFEEVLALVIFGSRGGAYWPSLHEVFTSNAIAWFGQGVTKVRYEELLWHVGRIGQLDSDVFFIDLFSAAGISHLPLNWRARVLAGADRGHSATDRSNLRFDRPIDFPAELGLEAKALVDYAAPSLRKLLGYE